MRWLILLALLLPSAAFAQTISYVKPPNAPTAFVQDYNVTIAVWVLGTGIGSYPAEFELHPDGKWYFGDGDSQLPQDLNIIVANIGAQGYLTTVFVPTINTILARRFPPIGGGTPGGGTGNANDQVNALLGQVYAIKNVGGVPVVSPK